VPACGYRPKDITDDGFEAAEEYFDGNASAEASMRSEIGPATEYGGPSLSEPGWAARLTENPSTPC
jgi:hypothetical protein